MKKKYKITGVHPEDAYYDRRNLIEGLIVKGNLSPNLEVPGTYKGGCHVTGDVPPGVSSSPFFLAVYLEEIQ